jgi:Zn-finger domain-containing protein
MFIFDLMMILKNLSGFVTWMKSSVCFKSPFSWFCHVDEIREYQVFKAGPQFLALKDHAAFKKNVETLGVALYKMESGDKKKSFDC